MCYKGKCLGCIPVEHGCLVFAIISAVASCLALVASIIVGLLLAAGYILAENDVHRRNTGDMVALMGDTFLAAAELALAVAVTVAALLSLIGFIFSVLLCNGICNRRPGQVKAYFVYGVVIMVITVLISVSQICTDNEPTPGIIALLVCAVYSLFLVLVHQTYAKLLEGTIFAVKAGHIRLVES